MKGTSVPRTRASLRGALHDAGSWPVSTLVAQPFAPGETDSGDTGTEEAAKKRPDQLPPCGDSPNGPSRGRAGGRSGYLGLLASPLRSATQVGGWQLGELGGPDELARESALGTARTRGGLRSPSSRVRTSSR